MVFSLAGWHRYLRPDRFVVAASLPQDLKDCIVRVAVALHLLPIAEPVVAGLAA
jgi:hypothetical protein